MRNQNWRVFSEQARRNLDFRQYLYQGDIWVPRKLKQGDVIRADLPTRNTQGEMEVMPRNCLVLGVDIDSQSMQLEAVRIMRLSYAGVFDGARDHEIILDPQESAYRFKLNGLKHAAVLRTGHVEILRAGSEFFGFAMDRLGSFSEEVFDEISEAIEKGYKAERQYNRLRSPVDFGIQGSFFASGLDPKDWEHSDAFRLDEARLNHANGQGASFRLSSPETQQVLTERMERHAPVAMLSSKEHRYREKGYQNQLTQEERETQRAIRKLLRSMANPRITLSRQELSRLINVAVREYGVAVTDELKPADTMSSIAAIPEFANLLEQHFGISPDKKEEQQKRLTQIFSSQSIDPNSLRDLETLGIGGLVRDDVIRLPQQLWRGRYVMMRIPNLGHQGYSREETYRPCALWRAFAKVNEQGDPELAALELHPCTRDSAEHYTHKMKVRPLDTTVPTPSFLIADLAIRAPITPQYFQPFQPQQGNFYELLPNMVDAFEQKRRMVETSGDMKIFGMKTLPEDWVEIHLPEPPNEKVRGYLGKRDIRFVGGRSPS